MDTPNKKYYIITVSKAESVQLRGPYSIAEALPKMFEFLSDSGETPFRAMVLDEEELDILQKLDKTKALR